MMILLMLEHDDKKNEGKWNCDPFQGNNWENRSQSEWREDGELLQVKNVTKVCWAPKSSIQSPIWVRIRMILTEIPMKQTKNIWLARTGNINRYS